MYHIVDVDILGLSLCSFWSNVPASVVLPSTLRFWLLKSVHAASECQLLSDFRLCLSTESEYRFSFSWIFFALYLFFQNPYKMNIIHIFSLWSCTLEQILAYPIDTFLIPCYHQNSLRACTVRTYFVPTWSTSGLLKEPRKNFLFLFFLSFFSPIL